jgi:phosphatidylglycerophosphate synthase
MAVRRGREWLGKIQTLADWISFSRLLLTAPIWVVAVKRQPRAAAGLVAAAAASDVLDGAVARISGKRSQFGGQLDTIADSAIILSSPGWIRLLYPATFQRRSKPITGLLAAAASIVILEWAKFHRFGNLHIHSTRAASTVAHFYALNLLLRGRDNDLLFRLFLILSGGAAVELVVVMVARDSLDGLSEMPLLDWMITRARR